MWVWQSHAPAGTSKLILVVGCDGLAWPARCCNSTPAAAAPNTNSRRPIMRPSLVEAGLSHLARWGDLVPSPACGRGDLWPRQRTNAISLLVEGRLSQTHVDANGLAAAAAGFPGLRGQPDR